MCAVICPVCKGRGVVYGIAETGAYPTQTCHGCNGKGWIEVHNEGYVFVDKCPTCGSNRNSPAGTGCLWGSHYRGYY